MLPMRQGSAGPPKAGPTSAHRAGKDGTPKEPDGEAGTPKNHNHQHTPYKNTPVAIQKENHHPRPGTPHGKCSWCLGGTNTLVIEGLSPPNLPPCLCGKGTRPADSARPGEMGPDRAPSGHPFTRMGALPCFSAAMGTGRSFWARFSAWREHG